MTSYQELREAIENVPCINAHVHQAGHQAEGLGSNDNEPVGFVRPALPESFADREYAAAMAAGEPMRAWRMFLAVWPGIRCSGYGRVLAAKLRILGLDDELNEDSYEELRRRLGQPSQEPAAAYAKAGIRASLTNVVGHPCFGGISSIIEFLEGRFVRGETFWPLLGVGPLHEFDTPAELEVIEKTAGMSIGTPEALGEAAARILERAVARGAVGIKDHRAYSRGLAFGRPDRTAAAALLRTIRSGGSVRGDETVLSDFVFDAILKRAADLDLTVAIHTGLLAGYYGSNAQARAHAQLLAPLIERHPNVRFDLYHLNLPWVNELLAILQRFPNTTANCVWAQHLDPAAMEEFLLRSLGALPADRVLGYGSDGGGLLYVLATLALSRDVIAGALARLVDRNTISRAAALDVAKIWLLEAPCKAYRLDARGRAAR